MNCFTFSFTDHAMTSWALHEVLRPLAKRPQVEGLAPIVYRFFPCADVEVRMKPQYRDLCCRSCGRYESDAVFDVGFEDPVTIRFRGDYGYTNDRIFVINDKFLKALKHGKVDGFETKPLGSSGWHALRVTLLVDHVSGVVKSRKPLCPECRRPRESFGAFEYVRQLSVPNHTNTLFTTKTGWPSSHVTDRPIFLTEEVLRVLRESGIAGGYCTRLLTEEDLKKQREKAKQGVAFWRPPGTSVRLNGTVVAANR